VTRPQLNRARMVVVASLTQGHPERSVDEDHEYTTSSMPPGSESSTPIIAVRGS
jgi:hypothetical protein